MSTELLVVFTVAEIVILIVVLGVYAVLLTQWLGSVAISLRSLSSGVAAMEADVGVLGPGVAELNRTLDHVVRLLPELTRRAEARTVAADPVRMPGTTGGDEEKGGNDGPVVAR